MHKRNNANQIRPLLHYVEKHSQKQFLCRESKSGEWGIWPTRKKRHKQPRHMAALHISSVRHCGANVIQLFETQCVYMIYKHPGMAYWRLSPKSRPECFCFEPVCGLYIVENVAFGKILPVPLAGELQKCSFRDEIIRTRTGKFIPFHIVLIPVLHCKFIYMVYQTAIHDLQFFNIDIIIFYYSQDPSGV